ncbi:MAG: acyloxyacyl hydrolase [Bacteroidota bacterium]
MSYFPKFYWYVIKVILLLYFGLYPAFSKSQGNRGSLSLSRQFSLHLFSAFRNKINGKVVGEELIYNISSANRPIAIVFNYKNLSHLKTNTPAIFEDFGRAYALLGALNFPILKTNRLRFNFSPGIGLGYISETWFTNGNPVIGSHLNFITTATLKATATLGVNSRLLAGLDIIHYSNAGIRMPNNGLNISSLSFGVVKYFKIKQRKDPIGSPDFFGTFKRYGLELGLNVGKRGVYHNKNSLYKSGIYIGYNFKSKAIVNLSIGLDAVYYYTIFDPRKREQTYQFNATSYNRWRIGIGIGPVVWIGKLALVAKYGYYLYFNSEKPILTYWTGGIKYALLNWAAIEGKIYVHRFEVDCLGLGVVFNTRLF